MAPERRRAMIAEAAVPLYLEYGADLSTRQLAERLDISEGTIFRAFGDKESLLHAVVEAFFTRARVQMAKGIVDPALPLEEKVAALVGGTREWMRGAMRMVSLIGRDEAAKFFSRPHDGGYAAALAAAFAPDADALNVPLDRLAAIMRIAGMAGAAHRGQHAALTDDELVHFILYGIAGVPRGEDA
jgi:AcrR family transcriptional regulator